ALVRTTSPEADPNPAGLVARLERLERLAGVVEGSIGSSGGPPNTNGPEVGGAGSAGQSPPNPRSASAADHLVAPASLTGESATEPVAPDSRESTPGKQ